jgi:hypothetical protein
MKRLIEGLEEATGNGGQKEIAKKIIAQLGGLAKVRKTSSPKMTGEPNIVDVPASDKNLGGLEIRFTLPERSIYAQKDQYFKVLLAENGTYIVNSGLVFHGDKSPDVEQAKKNLSAEELVNQFERYKYSFESNCLADHVWNVADEFGTGEPTDLGETTVEYHSSNYPFLDLVFRGMDIDPDYLIQECKDLGIWKFFSSKKVTRDKYGFFYGYIRFDIRKIQE